MLQVMQLEEIKKQMFAAMKAGRIIEKEVLRTVIGEVTQVAAGEGRDVSEEDIERVLRKVLKNNHETLALTEGNGKRRLLEQENEVIEALLPRTLDAAAIAQALQPVIEHVVAASSDGQAIGVAMKHLNGIGAPVNGKEVADVVRQLRS